MWDLKIIQYRALRYLNMKWERSIGEKSFVKLQNEFASSGLSAVIHMGTSGPWGSFRLP